MNKVIFAKKIICMAQNRKYPENPTPEDYQVPYDYVNFRKWCINTQAMSESTANSYISSIRTAFKELFAEDDALFKNIRNGMKLVPSKARKPEDWFTFMEKQMDRMIEYTEAIEKYGDIKLESRKKDSFELVASPKNMWVLAFQTYCRFVRWRIDGFRKVYGLETPVPKEKFLYIELPVKDILNTILKI